jgi:hypothetical protein
VYRIILSHVRLRVAFHIMLFKCVCVIFVEKILEYKFYWGLFTKSKFPEGLCVGLAETNLYQYT